MPYLPLYVQDFLTDEKLIECSAESTGVYIRLLCIMHKSHEYGKILLKQKDKQNPKQNESKILDFAFKLAKQMPWDLDVIVRGLTELAAEGVITIDGDTLFQKRMVKDGKISEIRSNAGKKGGKSSKTGPPKQPAPSPSAGFASTFASDFAQAKTQANSEIEIENEIDTEDKEIEEGNDKRGEGSRAREGPPDEQPDERPDEPPESTVDPELAQVINHYQDLVDPMPSPICANELIFFTGKFGAEIVIHAIDIGRDSLKGRVNWPYIKGILRRYLNENVQTIGDVRRLADEFEERTSAGRQAGGNTTARPSASAGAMDDLQQLHRMYEAAESDDQ